MKKSEELKREKYWSDELILPPECDLLCRFRSCYHKGEDKGSFTQGVGYTRYYETFNPCCMSRLSHGCGGRDTIPVDISEALTWCVPKLQGSTKEKKVAVRIIEQIATWLQKQEGVLRNE